MSRLWTPRLVGNLCKGLLAMVVMVAIITSPIWIGLAFCNTAHAYTDQVPQDAKRYRRDLVRQSRIVWGLGAPVASFAGQIHQESMWRAGARSNVGAQGLTQFMPATARWISGLDPKLAGGSPFNPTWAIRALVVYDKWLWDRLPQAEAPCDRMALAMRGYNGGLGYLQKEARRANSWEPQDMAVHCPRFRARASCRENLAYPARILVSHERKYASWGRQSCDGYTI